MRKLSYRVTSIILFLIVLCLLALDAWIQQRVQFTISYLDHIERMVLLALGAVFLMQALYLSRSQWGRFFYLGLELFITILGLFISGRHIWLQRTAYNMQMPIDVLTPKMQSMMSFGQLIRLSFAGTTASTIIQWKFLGVTLSQWTFIVFCAFFSGLLFYALLKILEKKPIGE